MRALTKFGIVGLLALCGCGLENMFYNTGHTEYDRPASVIRGKVTWDGATTSQLSVVAPDGSTIAPFQARIIGGVYELRLPSSNYAMLRVKARAGNVELRAIVPELGAESVAQGVDLDDRNTTETLIAEARLTADLANGALDASFKQVSPTAYKATRQLIRDAFSVAGPTAKLLGMVGRLLTPASSGGLFDPASGTADPDFFRAPELDKNFAIVTSPVYANALNLHPFDYVGDGRSRHDTSDFDAALTAAAQLYSPTGCVDQDTIRVVFTVDFNANELKDETCSTLKQYKWATDKPGKQMFFVGWIHKDSDIQPNDPDPAVAKAAQSFLTAMGNSTPNITPMFDNGTNGDEKGGDNVWTITFVAPRSKSGRVLRIGYKFTWGFAGQQWSGSEEWPGNSRILEVVDTNNDNYVYRRDVWADETSNKDNGNLNPYGNGVINWTTDLNGCGVPESHENRWYAPVSCTNVIDPNIDCAPLPTPKGIGPVKVACTN
jgi:hypothetical protein